jgi:hypothetical protein
MTDYLAFASATTTVAYIGLGILLVCLLMALKLLHKRK